MEMKKCRHTIQWLVSLLVFFLSSFVQHSSAQVAAYSIKNGRMYIQMEKGLKTAAIDSFIAENELEDLDLKNFYSIKQCGFIKKIGMES